MTRESSQLTLSVEEKTVAAAAADASDTHANGELDVADCNQSADGERSDNKTSSVKETPSVSPPPPSAAVNVHVQQFSSSKVAPAATRRKEYLEVKKDKSIHAKRSTSNVSNKSVSFCLKYIYSWYPASVNVDLVESYFESIPENKIPKIGSSGEKYRDIQLFRQIPPQDLQLDNCLFLKPQYHQTFQCMVQERNEKALDVATVVPVYDTLSTCEECGKRFYEISPLINDPVKEIDETEQVKQQSQIETSGDSTSSRVNDTLSVAIAASLTHTNLWLEKIEPQGDTEDAGEVGSKVIATNNNLWHPACFICCVCKELLVDLIYCRREGKLYCLRHYSETIWPRCPACDEVSNEWRRCSRGAKFCSRTASEVSCRAIGW